MSQIKNLNANPAPPVFCWSFVVWVTCFRAEQKHKDIHVAEVFHREISLLPTDGPIKTFIAVTWRQKKKKTAQHII